VSDSTLSSATTAGDSALDAIEHNRLELRERGRRALGITGDERPPALRPEIRRSGVGWYPLVALMALILIDQFQTSALTTLSPDIARSFGVSATVIAALYGLQALAMSFATLPMSAFVQARPRRAALAVITALTWSVATALTAFTGGILALAIVVVVVGAASGSVRSVHMPLLFDYYPASTRARIYSGYLVALWGSLALAPALVALLTYVHLTWRGTFLALGVISLLISLCAVRLRDPGFGRWDTEALRDLVKDEAEDPGAAAAAAAQEGGGNLRFFEIVRRLLLIPTVKRLLVGYVALGVMVTPLATFTSFYLDDEWHLGASARGVFNVCSYLLALPCLLVSGRYIERWYRSKPARVPRATAIALAVGVALIGAGVLMPVFWLMAICYAVGIAMFASSTAAIGTAAGNVVPARMRVHLASLANIALYGAGGLLGQLLLGSIYDSSGPKVAIFAVTVPGLIAAAIVFTAHRTIDEDLDRMVDEIVEQEEVRQLVADGTRLPMLSCRRIDAGYDGVQVLFDVSFSVDEGEMVALLGTNGAGKSTLLKVISGLLLPTRGSVRLHGEEITYLDPGRRLTRGIQHVAGGHGTFPGLTVVENLRTYGYSLGRDRRAVERGVEEAFAIFPRLAERRNQKAVTMSGGENQMLALSRVLLRRPQLLVIDELSLGLAPKVVGELLTMVRRINADGTAVVLVEQSVNIALATVEHAYFMEKGEVRFDGKAADLRERDDLLRAVFLEGTAKAAAR